MPAPKPSLFERVAALEAKDRKHDSQIPKAMRAVSESVHEFDATITSVATYSMQVAKALDALRESDERIATEQRAQAELLAAALRKRVTIAGIFATATPILIAIARALEALWSK